MLNAVSILQTLQERPDLMLIQRLAVTTVGARSDAVKTGTS